MQIASSISDEQFADHLKDVGGNIVQSELKFFLQAQVPGIYEQIPVSVHIDICVCPSQLHPFPRPHSSAYHQRVLVQQSDPIAFINYTDQLESRIVEQIVYFATVKKFRNDLASAQIPYFQIPVLSYTDKSIARSGQHTFEVASVALQGFTILVGLQIPYSYLELVKLTSTRSQRFSIVHKHQLSM